MKILLSLLSFSACLLAQSQIQSPTLAGGATATAGALTQAAPVACGTQGATTVCDFSTGNVLTATLSANVTTLTLSNPRGSGPYELRFTQNSTGSFSVTCPGSFAVCPPIDPGPNDTTIWGLKWDGSSTYSVAYVSSYGSNVPGGVNCSLSSTNPCGVSYPYTVGTGGVTAASCVTTSSTLDGNSHPEVVNGTTGCYGFAKYTASAGATAWVARSGQTIATADSSGWTVLHLLTQTSSANTLTDSGQTSRSAICNNVRVVAVAFATVSANGTGLVELSPYDYGTMVCQVNGATVPASATVLGSNSSSQAVAASLQGNGAKVQLSTGSTVTNDCVKYDANGNTVDAGAACGSGGGDTVTSPGGSLTVGGSSSATTLDANKTVESFTVGTGGVTANTLVIADTSNPAKIIAATGSGGYGIAQSTVSASGTVIVTRLGQALCVADNTVTEGDLVIPGTSTVIDCKDSGQTSSANIPTTTRIIGSALSSATAGNTFTVALLPGHYGTQSSGSSAVILGQTGDWWVPGGSFAISAYADSNTNTQKFGESANQASAYRVYMPGAWTANKINFYQAVACASGDDESVAMYNASGTQVLYTGVLSTSTTVACNAIGNKQITSSTSPACTGCGTQNAAGWYYVVVTATSVTPTMSAMQFNGFIASIVTGITSYWVSTSGGVLPGTLPTLTAAVGGAVPLVLLQY